MGSPKSFTLKNRSIGEFQGIDTPNNGKIYSMEHLDIAEFLDKNPVDFIINFSINTVIYSYGKLAV